jgi:hypothetical protein
LYIVREARPQSAVGPSWLAGLAGHRLRNQVAAKQLFLLCRSSLGTSDPPVQGGRQEGRSRILGSSQHQGNLKWTDFPLGVGITNSNTNGRRCRCPVRIGVQRGSRVVSAPPHRSPSIHGNCLSRLRPTLEFYRSATSYCLSKDAEPKQRASPLRLPGLPSRVPFPRHARMCSFLSPCPCLGAPSKVLRSSAMGSTGWIDWLAACLPPGEETNSNVVTDQ